ncbi:hypothetical protein [Prevotella communis]|nr:hypothetical protein [Prevotella communis]
MAPTDIFRWPSQMGTIDKLMSYDDYIYDEAIKEQKAKMYE